MTTTGSHTWAWLNKNVAHICMVFASVGFNLADSGFVYIWQTGHAVRGGFRLASPASSQLSLQSPRPLLSVKQKRKHEIKKRKS